MFKETKSNTRINIKKYISDITYEDETGWDSLIVGEYDCYIIRNSEKDFRIEFCLKYNEINIEIDTIVELFKN